MTTSQATQPVTSAGPQFDGAQLQYALEKLRSEQNIMMGLVAGAIAALVGAGAWAAITVITEYQIGWMAVGVGFLVGIAMRTFGKGIDKVFGILGATLALCGCGLGNLLAVCGMIASAQGMGFLDVLSELDLNAVSALMKATFSPMDLLFYGIAVYEGYHLSLRQLTQQEVAASVTGSPHRPA